MLPFHLEFARPGWLLLLLLAPVIWWWGRHSLAGLGRWRRWVALALRWGVLALLVAALAEMQLVRSSDRLTVIFLLDQSLSIPQAQRQAMIEYTNRAIAAQRHDLDRAGVIVFGQEAALEIPPFDDVVQMPSHVESALDSTHTNLAAALKLAQASFPEDAARRVVIVSDGNQNMGDALAQARGLVDAGVAIDVQPVSYAARADVSVEKLALPGDVRQGQPFDMRIVLNNEGAEPVSGTLRVSQIVDGQPRTLSEQPLTVRPGKQVLTLRQQIDLPNFYTFEAQFVPDRPADDAISQNNRATNFTYIRGSGQVLVFEDHEHPGEFNLFVEQLRAQNLEVQLRPTNQLFTSLAELQSFDTVVLANVPREHFSDEQVAMLVSNTEQMGAGLIMVGGPNSFGAGGWSNTPLEAAMPLDFQIKNAKVLPKGALALVMHASELAQGNFWQKKIAGEAIRTLGDLDYCGLLHWDGTDRWLWRHPIGLVPVGGNRGTMLAQLDRMTPGDMPAFDPSLALAKRGFDRVTDAAVKHMIVISDGDPAPPSPQVVQGLVASRVTVTTVAVGTHGPAGSNVLQALATQTGGKYYAVTNNAALPRIFQKEARTVARPLVHEDAAGFASQIVFPHEMVSGIARELPPLTGMVLTTIKPNPLVEAVAVSQIGVETANSTLLASWTYGLGKSLCFTSDTGARWATGWTDWDDYGKFFSQMVRWSMRPLGDTGQFSVATDVENGVAQVVITALDENDDFENFLEMGATVLGPDMKPRELRFEQTAPGRYVGRFEATDAGSYFFSVSPGPGKTPIRSGLNVPYSAEFRDKETNHALLDLLAALRPEGAPLGRMIFDPQGAGDMDALLEVDVFRHDLPKARSSQDIWHLLLACAACVFLADVFVRRVRVDLAWVPRTASRAYNRLRGRTGPAPATQYMDRLRSRKAEVAERIEERRAAARFEAPVEEMGTGPVADDAIAQELAGPRGKAPPAAPRAPAAGGTSEAPKTDDEGYTSRLLKAKKKVWEDRPGEGPADQGRSS